MQTDAESSSRMKQVEILTLSTRLVVGKELRRSTFVTNYPTKSQARSLETKKRTWRKEGSEPFSTP